MAGQHLHGDSDGLPKPHRRSSMAKPDCQHRQAQALRRARRLSCSGPGVGPGVGEHEVVKLPTKGSHALPGDWEGSSMCAPRRAQRCGAARASRLHSRVPPPWRAAVRCSSFLLRDNPSPKCIQLRNYFSCGRDPPTIGMYLPDPTVFPSSPHATRHSLGFLQLSCALSAWGGRGRHCRTTTGPCFIVTCRP
jgi:hypothetical protein